MTIFCIIDVETTGVDPKVDRVIEVGAVRMENETAISFEALVNPGRNIAPNVSAINHIIDADVANADPIPTVMGRMLEAFGGPDFFVAHNADFEKKFLGLDKWICTYKCALRTWPSAPTHSNEGLRYWLGLPDLGRAHAQRPHTALHDAQVTASILLALLAKYDAGQLFAWSGEPAKLPTCPLGKHRGAAWADVPTDYLSWVVNKAQDMREDVKHCALVELKRRLGK